MEACGGAHYWGRAGLAVCAVEPPATSLRRRVFARDVSLVLAPPDGSSILNVFPVHITGYAEERASQVIVRLDVGGTPLLARITAKSVAPVKSMALLD